MATKVISIAWPETAKTVYCIIRRNTDGYKLNDANGAFASNPADPYLSLTEDAIIKGLYEVSESRTVWTDDTYLVVVYKQNGANPSPIVDTIIGSEEMYIVSDAEVIVSTDVSFIFNCIKNKKYLIKIGSVWYLKIRNADDSADIVSKPLKDKNGNNITDIHAGILAQELKSDV